MQDCKVNILGTEYKIYNRNEKDDPLLDEKMRDGYTDFRHTKLFYAIKKMIANFRIMKLTKKLFSDMK